MKRLECWAQASAGKTTLFGIITGMLEPNAGQILFDGALTTYSYAGASLPARHRALAVPDSQPFGGMTVFGNLVVAGAFAKRRREQDVYDLATRSLEDCGLGDKANVKADKLTLLDRKRLELARAARPTGSRCSTKSPAAPQWKWSARRWSL